MASRKKRKAEADLDSEGGLQGSFVSAANSVSQLFTAAVQQNKRARVEGAADVLVRPALTVAAVLLGSARAPWAAGLPVVCMSSLHALWQSSRWQPAQTASLEPCLICLGCLST